jgi:hypothetical protein
MCNRLLHFSIVPSLAYFPLVLLDEPRGAALGAGGVGDADAENDRAEEAALERVKDACIVMDGVVVREGRVSRQSFDEGEVGSRQASKCPRSPFSSQAMRSLALGVLGSSWLMWMLQ